MSFNEKQSQIISAAEKLFAIKGFDGTTVRDIADEAGINLAMISYYFGSKEKLMEAVFEQRTANFSAKIEDLIKNELLTPFEKIEIVISDYINKVLEKQAFYKLMICEQMMEKNTFIISLLNDLKRKNTELIEKLIQEGQGKGVFKPDIDIVLLSSTLIGTVMQSFINRNHYMHFNQLEALTPEKFKIHLQQKLTDHLKLIFKAILLYEA